MTGSTGGTGSAGNPLVYFTATGTWDSRYEATVLFYPRVSSTFNVLQLKTAMGLFNTAVRLSTVRARISGGHLVPMSHMFFTSATGVPLLASTSAVSAALAAIGFSGGLKWDVEFINVTYANQPSALPPFGFAAPSTAATVDISSPQLSRLSYKGR